MTLDPSVPIHVGILTYPSFCAFDVFGAYTVLGVPPLMGVRPNIHVHLVGRTKEPFSALPPWPMIPTMTYAECPERFDVIALGAMPPSVFADEETLAWVAHHGRAARYVLGVCAGAHVLGAAGLLRGKRATSNFHMIDSLAAAGAIPTRQHIVVDGNIYTTGPSVGGYDASLRILGELCGADVAREIELHLEHVSEPPFGTGRPDLAGPELTKLALSHGVTFATESERMFTAACERFARRDLVA